MVANSPVVSPMPFVTSAALSPHPVIRLSPKPDRRQSEDRRRVPRGGRRATDAQVPGFASHHHDSVPDSTVHRAV